MEIYKDVRRSALPTNNSTSPEFMYGAKFLQGLVFNRVNLVS